MRFKKVFIRIIRAFVRPFCKPYIVFESIPNYSDSPFAVYNEFRKRGYEKKYNLVWWLGNRTISFEKNNTIIRRKIMNKSLSSIFFGALCYFNTKTVILSNRIILSDNADVSFYLTHGTPLKHIRDYYVLSDRIDYCIAPSEAAREILSYELNYDYDKITALGYPRNDAFSEPPKNLNIYFSSHFDKYIVWYPTFRQHKNGNKTASKASIPLITSIDKAQKINSIAKEKNTLLVIKPHFAQDVTKIKKLALSNIVFIDDDFLVTHNISSYQLLNSCDALLSDYSSVYCDYLLTENPIGLIWEDIEEYKQNPGLYPKYEEITKGINKIYTIEELIEFINMVADGEDPLKEERNKLCKYLNVSNDGKNTERVVDFIVEKAKL